MHITYFPDRAPFVVQDATTRVWVLNEAGWRLPGW
jgi:hypothetical protein